MIIEQLLDELSASEDPAVQELLFVIANRLQKNTPIQDSLHRVQQTWLNDEVPVVLDENGDGRDPMGDAYFDRINLVGGSATVNADEPRQIDISLGGTGAGADCMFDYLVSGCFADLPGFTEGTLYTSVSGCHFKGYTTIQGAVTDALTNPSGLGQGQPFIVNNDQVAAIYVCGGVYAEAITTSSNQMIRLVGAGRKVTVVGGATSSNPTLGFAFGCQFWITGFEWLCSSGGHALSVVGSSNVRVDIWDCDIVSSSSTNIGIEASGALNFQQLSVHDCYFSGETGILTNAGNSNGSHKIYDCLFDHCTIGINSDEYTEVNDCLFVACTTAIGIINGSQGIYIKNNHFSGGSTTAIKLAASTTLVERLWVMDNTFGSDIAGITCFFDASAFGGGSSTGSDTWTIANNHGLSCSTSFVKWNAGTWSRTQDWTIRLLNNSVKTGVFETGSRPGFLFSAGNWEGNAPVEGVVGRGMSSQLWYWIDDNDFQFGVIPFTCRFGDTPVYYPGGTFTITTAGTFQVELNSSGTVTVTASATNAVGVFPIVEFTTTLFGVDASYLSHRNTAGIPYVAVASGGGGTTQIKEAFVSFGAMPTGYSV